MQREIAIERYEQLILKKNSITLNGEAEEKAEAAKAIIRYAITEILQWTPEEARDHITWDIIKQMKLDKILRYIPYPTDIDKVKDPDYMIYSAFPDMEYDIRRQILRVYNRLMNGEIEEFPKKIFEGPRGREKAVILLDEIIRTRLSTSSIEQLYERFADTAKANRKLAEWKIYSISRKLYCTPLDYLHYSLSEENRDEFLYTFYQYRNVSKLVKNMERFQKTKKKKKVEATN